MSYKRLAESLKKELEEIKQQKSKNKDVLILDDPIKFVIAHVAHPLGAPQDMWFHNRPYLLPLYRDESKRIVIVKARQMEITEYAANMLLYWALKRRGVYVYATSTRLKAKRFSTDRFRNKILKSPDIKKRLKSAEMNRYQLGDSLVYIDTAWDNARSLRGIAADALILDEFQDMQDETLAVAQEILTKSEFKKLIVIGNPQLSGTTFEKTWNLYSDKKEWDKDKQQWVPTVTDEQRPYSGYHITQEMAVGLWMKQEDIETKRNTLPRQQFFNEVLGLFYSGIGRPQNANLLFSLFDPTLPKLSYTKGELLVAGVDWGVGAKASTVFWLSRPRLVEYPDSYGYDTLYVEKIEDPDIMNHITRVIKLCTQHPVSIIALDIGAGYLQNQQLYKTFGNKIINVMFVNRPQVPYTIEPSIYGDILKVDRTWALDKSLDLITKRGYIRWYNETDEAVKQWIVDDFLAEYPDVTPSGRKEWTHSKDSTDDALMAYTYSILAHEVYRIRYSVSDIEDSISFV